MGLNVEKCNMSETRIKNRRITLAMAMWLGLMIVTISSPFLSLVRAQELQPRMMLSRVTEMFNSILTDMKTGKYDQALTKIPTVIEQLRFYEKEQPRYAEAIERLYYNRAVCHIEMKRWDDSITNFQLYVNTYPKGLLVRPAHILWADSHAAKGEWEKVIEVIGRIIRDPGLLREEQQACMQLVAEAFFTLNQWEKAIEPNLWVFRNGDSLEARLDSAVRMTVSFARLERFKDLYRFVPVLFKTDAKYDLRLQITLLEEGDNKEAEGMYDKALLFYRLVYFKHELVSQLEKRLQDLNRQRQIAQAREQSGEPSISGTVRRIDRLLEGYKAQLDDLSKMPDYDYALTLRMGNCYFELQRYFEAIYLYRSIFEESPQHELAQQGLYAAFTTAFAMDDIERALKEGYDYVKAYPNGNYWETITVNLATIHLDREEWQAAIDIAKKGIEVKPGHVAADNLFYIIGYSQFQLSELHASMRTMETIFEKHARSQFLQPALYWHAMGHLFEAHYVPAREEFMSFTQRYTGGHLREDAMYRLGVAYYGEPDFPNAKKALLAFAAEFPESHLVAEAYAMLGDIDAADGMLDEAIAHYKKSAEMAINMVQADYALLQQSRTLELEGYHEEVIAIWREYLKRFGDMANFTEAYYWIGNSQRALNDLKSALNTFYDAIVKYGNVAENYGIDMMIRDLILEFENLPEGASPTDPQAMILYDMRSRLRDELGRSSRDNKITLSLRLSAMFAAVTKNEEARRPLVDSILRESVIPDAAPITLVWMGREATARKDHGLAQKVYSHFLEFHESSDLVLEALVGKAEALLAQNKMDEALTLLDSIATRFATSEEAGWANIRMGDIYRKKNDLARALDHYSLVLSVKEWRGELWPEALYNTGEAMMQQGKPKEAFAMFQRIYVLYAGYPSWTAKAYLRSGEVLELLGDREAAKRTYQEMLAAPAINAQPEAEAVRKRLAALGGGEIQG